jgi:hypothetical protein
MSRPTTIEALAAKIASLERTIQSNKDQARRSADYGFLEVNDKITKINEKFSNLKNYVKANVDKKVEKKGRFEVYRGPNLLPSSSRSRSESGFTSTNK